MHPRYFIINMSCTLHCCCCLMALSPPREHSNISHPVGLSSDGAWMCRAQISADKILLKHQQYPLDQLRAQHGINQRAGNRAFAECCGLCITVSCNFDQSLDVFMSSTFALMLCAYLSLRQENGISSDRGSGPTLFISHVSHHLPTSPPFNTKLKVR